MTCFSGGYGIRPYTLDITFLTSKNMLHPHVNPTEHHRAPPRTTAHHRTPFPIYPQRQTSHIVGGGFYICTCIQNPHRSTPPPVGADSISARKKTVFPSPHMSEGKRSAAKEKATRLGGFLLWCNSSTQCSALCVPVQEVEPQATTDWCCFLI